MADLVLAKKMNKVAWVLTVVISAVVFGMRPLGEAVRPHLPEGLDFSYLPPFHSTMNALTAVVLLVALYFVKQKKVDLHRKMIYLAMGLSAIFLVSYVTYHITTPEVKYGGEGFMRGAYFFLLITHILSAAVIFPFILFTFVRAYTGQVERHRKMARWVFPVWLYVAVTGPICYLMLMPYY